MTTKRKKRRRDHFPVAFVATFATLLGVVAILAYLPQFRLSRVTIYGQTSLNSGDILPLVEPQGDPFFVIGLGPDAKHWLSLRYGDLEEDLLTRFPILESVRVQFQFPSTVRVEVIDKPEVVTARVPEGYALLDSKGTVISVRDAPSIFLPVTEGFQLNGAVVVGDSLPVEEEQFEQAMRATAALIAADRVLGYEHALMSLTKQITVLDGRIRFDLLFDSGARWRVTFDDNSALTKNVAYFSDLIAQGLLDNEGSGSIIMSSDSIVFQPDEP